MVLHAKLVNAGCRNCAAYDFVNPFFRFLLTAMEQLVMTVGHAQYTAL